MIIRPEDSAGPQNPPRRHHVRIAGTLAGLVTSLLLGCSQSDTGDSFSRLIQVSDAEIDRALATKVFSSGEVFSSMELARNDRMSAHLVQILGREPAHIHAHHDLLVTVRRGSGILQVGQQVAPLVPGAAQVVRRGHPHCAANTGGIPLILVSYFFPPFDGQDRTLLTPPANE